MENRMEKIVSLCKRRGFIFQSSEIYGGLNGFWDYGPLGVELKRNVREAWWADMISNHNELVAPPGAPQPFQMVGLETSIIMHPQVWKACGHYDQFHDMMVDCKETKKRYRFDHIRGRWAQYGDKRIFITTDLDGEEGLNYVHDRGLKYFGLKKKEASKIEWGTGQHGGLSFGSGTPGTVTPGAPYPDLRPIWDADSLNNVLAPHASEPGTLTEPREFNLMFKTIIGALGGEEDAAFLRPETAQGMFVNFKNVLDSVRLKVPFGIAQIGKSFRNEITPRNFTFRSREFEQMEMEFFCPPGESRQWYEYWRDRRLEWYVKLGITSDNLRLRDHTPDELSHYSVGTADVEYAFPFLEAGEFGELEGVAHRGDFDLRSHMEGKLVKDENDCLVVEIDAEGSPKYRGSGKDLTYFDSDAFERDKERLGVKSFKEYLEQRQNEPDPGAPYQYIPHVIEPAAGADRATLAFLCEAYDEDEQPDEKGKLQHRVVMRLHPRLAPIKAAVFPLVKRDGMPEVARDIYGDLKTAGLAVYYDEKGAIGRRYRRQDEAGTPFCITVDSQTLQDQTVTVRDRDTLAQDRVPISDVVDVIRDRLKA